MSPIGVVIGCLILLAVLAGLIVAALIVARGARLGDEHELDQERRTR